jgi:signal transduction histidine kinase
MIFNIYNSFGQKVIIKSKIDQLNDSAKKYAQDGKIKQAVSAYQNILILAADSPKLKAKILNEIGNLYGDMGDNPQALKSYLEGLEFAPENDNLLNATINKNIGALYLSWEKLDDALKYDLIAEEFAIKAKDERIIADLANNKGAVYEQKFQFKKANSSYQKALIYYLKNGINDRICLTYNNLAILFKVQKDFNQSANYYQKSVDFAVKANNKWLTAAIGNNLGNLLSEMGRYKESDKALLDALKLEKEISAGELIPETLENIANNEKRLGNFKKAFDYMKLMAVEKDKFINSENIKEVVKLQEQFDAVKKQKQIELLNKEGKIQQLTLVKKNTTIGVIIGVFVVILIISVLVFSRYKLNQVNKLKLATAETKNQVQEEKLRISQELHDNIGAQLSFINSSIGTMFSNDKENIQLQETQTITQNTIRELRSTVWLINQQEFSLDEFVIKLRDYVKPYHTGKPHITIEDLSEGNIILKPLTATNLFRVIQEVVNNAIKHADATALNISIKNNSQELELLISDNGKGFERNGKANGYGLKNINSRIQNINGKCLIESKIGEGTQVKLNIPV